MSSSVKSMPFGTLPDGDQPRLFILDNGAMRVGLTEYGAALTSAIVPTGEGGWLDLLLGPSSLAGYASHQPYFGATVGRFANRIGASRFGLDGREYELSANDGKNSLHGGIKGFDKRCWNAEPGADRSEAAVRMELVSPDGDQGYPGRLEASVMFVLGADCSLTMRFEARSDAPTPVSLTNHAYFNLRGEGNGSVLGHELELRSTAYLPVGDALIPLPGAPAPVAGGPFDFTAPKPIGRDIGAAGGYDHCFVIDGCDGTVRTAAIAVEPESGRRLELRTDMPGVQFYSGNFLSGVAGKRGSVYDRHSGFCLEAEYYPDSPNRPDYPDCVLRPGRLYAHTIEYRFGF